MSALSPVASPPARTRSEWRSQQKPSLTMCNICSPPSRGICSPPSRGDLPATETECSESMDDPSALLIEGWCSPSLKSPAGRPCSVMRLASFQSAAPVNIFDPFLEEEQWDKEAMVLSTIAGQLEDEEDEDEDVACGEAEADEEATLDLLPPELSCALAHASTPLGLAAASMVPYGATSVSAHGSRLPTSGTAEERKNAHWEMASKGGHAAFECGCRVAKARGARSCLDQFGREQFRRWHNETYELTAWNTTTRAYYDPAMSIHHKMWQLKEPIDLKGGEACDGLGRKWKIPTWKLDGHEVSVDDAPRARGALTLAS